MLQHTTLNLDVDSIHETYAERTPMLSVEACFCGSACVPDELSWLWTTRGTTRQSASNLLGPCSRRQTRANYNRTQQNNEHMKLDNSGTIQVQHLALMNLQAACAGPPGALRHEHRALHNCACYSASCDVSEPPVRRSRPWAMSTWNSFSTSSPIQWTITSVT